MKNAIIAMLMVLVGALGVMLFLSSSDRRRTIPLPQAPTNVGTPAPNVSSAVPKSEPEVAGDVKLTFLGCPEIEPTGWKGQGPLYMPRFKVELRNMTNRPLISVQVTVDYGLEFKTGQVQWWENYATQALCSQDRPFKPDQTIIFISDYGRYIYTRPDLVDKELKFFDLTNSVPYGLRGIVMRLKWVASDPLGYHRQGSAVFSHPIPESLIAKYQ